MATRDASELEATLGHHFAQPGLLGQALTHGSLRHEQQTSTGNQPLDVPATETVQDNERLEFLGDAIVGLLVAELLYRRYPELQEGALTRLRAALVSRKHLGNVGLALGLGNYLRLGRAEERSGGRKKAVLLANCMEALIGALYLEGGLAAAGGFVERVVAGPYLEELRGQLREHRAIGDYKSALQELLQSRGAGQPEYLVEAESGPDHRKRFLVEVRVGLAEAGAESVGATARGEGTTKKKAEQEAARLIYSRLTAQSENRRREPSERAPAAPAAEVASWDGGGAELPGKDLPGYDRLSDDLEDTHSSDEETVYPAPGISGDKQSCSSTGFGPVPASNGGAAARRRRQNGTSGGPTQTSSIHPGIRDGHGSTSEVSAEREATTRQRAPILVTEGGSRAQPAQVVGSKRGATRDRP